MASTISAGTTSGTAIAIAGDTSGSLELKTNNGTTAVTIDTAQNVGIGTASPSSYYKPNVVINNSNSTGLSIIDTSTTLGMIAFGFGSTGTLGGNSNRGKFWYDLANDSFNWNTAGTGSLTPQMRIDSSGNVGIGNTGSTSFKFNVTGTGTSSAAFAFRAEDSGTFNLFSARNDGFISTGTRAVSPYNNTTGSAANMFVDSAGGLARSTSSLKYKTDVQDATHGLEDLLKLRSVTYKQKNADADGNPVNTVFGGLIAEEVDATGLTEFVQYAEDGSPDALAYGNMVAICIKAIQELNAKIDAQALEIQALKGTT